MEKMNVEQALSILDQATAQITANRQAHGQIMKALETLREFTLRPMHQPNLVPSPPGLGSLTSQSDLVENAQLNATKKSR